MIKVRNKMSGFYNGRYYFEDRPQEFFIQDMKEFSATWMTLLTEDGEKNFETREEARAYMNKNPKAPAHPSEVPPTDTAPPAPPADPAPGTDPNSGHENSGDQVDPNLDI